MLSQSSCPHWIFIQLDDVLKYPEICIMNTKPGIWQPRLGWWTVFQSPVKTVFLDTVRKCLIHKKSHDTVIIGCMSPNETKCVIFYSNMNLTHSPQTENMLVTRNDITKEHLIWIYQNVKKGQFFFQMPINMLQTRYKILQMGLKQGS